MARKSLDLSPRMHLVQDSFNKACKRGSVYYKNYRVVRMFPVYGTTIKWAIEVALFSGEYEYPQPTRTEWAQLYEDALCLLAC